MPTKNQIIEELYQSKEFNDCINKMEPKSLRDDLRSEVMLVLCEKEPAFIQDLYERGSLKYFAVGIIIKSIRSSTSQFYKKYRQYNPVDIRLPEVGFNEELQADEINARIKREAVQDKALMLVESMDEYPREIVKLYMKVGSYRKIEKETYIPQYGRGIPWQSCYTTIQKAFKQIKDELINS